LGEEPVRSASEVLEIALEVLGPSHPFDPAEHLPSKRELWVNQDKERFFFRHRRYPGGAA
jgi:hypothetical protein